MPAIEGIADRMDVRPDGWSVVEEPLQETLKKSARTSLEIFKIFSYLSLLENENNENKKTRNLQPIRFRILQAAHRLSALDLPLRTILFSRKIKRWEPLINICQRL